MARTVTLFTGQWADMPLDTLAKKVTDWGYDGLELACWGDHFEVEKAHNYDPSHFGYQGVDYVAFISTFADRIYHVHMRAMTSSPPPSPSISSSRSELSVSREGPFRCVHIQPLTDFQED